MLSDQDPLLPSSSNPFHLDLHGKSTLNTITVADLQLENDVIHSLEEVASSQSSVIFETEPNLENMESCSPASISEGKSEQSNEDALKVVRPTSKEFKKTWGFRRTTIAKREVTADTEMEANLPTPPQMTPQQQIQQMQQVRQQLQLHLQQLKERHSAPSQSSLRRSGRQPKRTERVEEFMTTVRRNRIRRSAPTPLEDASETSCPVTDVETASEGSVESMAEIKSESLRNDTGDIEDPLVTGATEIKGDDDDSSSDSDALTLKEIQDRLRKRQSGKITAEFVEHTERPTEVELPAVKVEPPDFEVELCIKSMPPPKVDLPNVKVELSAIKVEPPTTPERKPECEGLVAEKCITAVEVKQEIADSSGLLENMPEDVPKPRPESDGTEVLYCICRQPHNKRFMICCERCEEWFHGDCVGISEARGQLVERNGEDYICPNCILLPVKEEVASDSDQVVSTKEQGSMDSAVCNTSGTVYQKSDDPGIKGRIEKAADPSKKKKLKLFNPIIHAPVVPKCIGPGCSVLAQPDSVYCSPDCILKHAAATMKFLSTGKDSKPKEKVKSKPEKNTAPKSLTMLAGKKRPTRHTEKRVAKMKNMIVLVSKTEVVPASITSEPLGGDSPPSWESDHNYNAVKSEKTDVPVEAAAASPCVPPPPPPAPPPPAPPAAITSTVFYKSGNEVDAKQVEPASLAPTPVALPSMKKRIAALPRIPMLKRPQSSDPAQSQTPVRSSPLSSINPPLKPSLGASGHTSSRIIVTTRPIAPSAVGAGPATKKSKLSTGNDGSGQKTYVPSSSPSYVAGTVRKIEGSSPSLNSVAGSIKKAESPSASPSSAAEAFKKTDGSSASIGVAGAAKRIEGPSTSNTTAKPATNPSQSQPNLQMRLNIRRSLKEILWKRVGDSDDLVMPEGEVAKIAVNIEKEMFGLFRETDSRYKSKYRNLMLNLKDPKNQGLFHRVLREEISLSKLVRLKPEELISKRMSSWKTRPPKPNVNSKTKSHLETRGSDTRPNFADMEDSPPVSSSDEQEQPPSESAKPVAPEKSHTALPDIFSSMLNDTTNQHRAHLFDLNCKICTGQMAVSDDDVPPRRTKTPLALAKKTELKPKNDFKMKAENAASTAAQLPAGQVPEAAGNVSTSASVTDSHQITEKAAASPGPATGESTLPRQGPLYPDTSAAGVVTTVTVSGRDPRTALNRSAVTPSPDLSANLARDKTTVGDTKSEMPKSILTMIAAPKSILMKPSSSLEPRYLPSSSMNHNITACQSTQDGDTSLFLSRLGTIWKGFINMQSVAKFVTKAYPVSGSIDYLDEDLPDTIHIGGRISPKTVWDYVSKLKSSVSKELCLIRFHPATEEEEVAYISLYSYFSSRGRFGVVANNNRHIKDLYLIPLSAKDPIPSKLLPFDGPGLESTRPNLLLGLVICQKGKRPMSILESEKTEEKRSKVQIQEETDIIYSKTPVLFQQEKKILKYQPFSKEPTIIPSPPRSPKSPPAEPPTVAAPTLFSSLPSFKTATVTTTTTAAATTTTITAPSIPTIITLPETSASKSAASSTAKSATPLEHILKTLFGKKKPFDSEAESLNLVNDQATPDQKKGAATMVDPIIQQFGQTSKEKILEEVGDDRPYDPEEEYDPEKAFAMDTIPEPESLHKPEQSSETVPQEDEAYDPEDETIFEEVKVVVDDFPNKVSSSVKPINTELPSEYASSINTTSSLVEQQKMLEELNKQIEEQKRQLEAQEEALRQQRAAVGVSMAHFSVSDALMSPPPKSSLTKSELFQQEEQGDQSEIKPEVDLSSDHLLHATPTSTDSKHTLDFWQAASRLLREANQSSNYKVPQERKSESPAKEKPLASSESKTEISSSNEPVKDVDVATQSMSSADSKPDPDAKAFSSEKDNQEKDCEKMQLTDSLSTESVHPAMSEDTCLSKPAFVSGHPVSAETTLQCTFTAPSSKDHCQKDLHDTTVPETSRVHCTNTNIFSQTKKLSDCIDPKQECASAPQKDHVNPAPPQFIEKKVNPSEEDQKSELPAQHFEDNRQTTPYPLMMRNTGPPPPQFTAPPNPQMPLFRAPLLNFSEYRGPAPQSFPGRSPSNSEQHGPSSDRFGSPNNTVPPFPSGQYGQPSHFEHSRSPSISHPSDEKGESPSQVEDYGASQNEFQDSWFDGKDTGPSQFESQRGPGGSQLMGNVGKQTFPYGEQRRPPPPHFTANRGSVMQHQFVGMRGPAPNMLIGTRSPHPNEFGEQMPPISSCTQERRAPPSSQFEEMRNQQPTFKNPGGSSPRALLGPKGPRVSRFSEPNESLQSRFHYHEPSPQNTPSRFNYQEQFPQNAKSSPRPPPEFPNYSPQHRKVWEKDSSIESGEMLNPGQRSPNEFREGKEYDQRTPNFEARYREREEFSKDQAIVEEQTHPIDSRKNRGFDERRGGRGRGSWNRGNGRNWNRERDGERYREGERCRDGDRNRDGERNRDWDRHRERDPNREWDKSRERDRDLEKNKEFERSRDRPRHRDRERDSSKRRERERSRSRDRNRDMEREERERFREHDRDRTRDRERDRARERDRVRERDRDRERDGDRDRCREWDRERGSDRDRGDRDRGKDCKERSTSKESSRDFKADGQKEAHKPTETQASPSIQQT